MILPLNKKYPKSQRWPTPKAVDLAAPPAKARNTMAAAPK